MLTIGESIPDDANLTEATNNCAIKEADSKGFGLTAEGSGSCFVEIITDYTKNKMIVTATSVGIVASFIDPYDDMFGFAKGIKSVIQYKIYMNLEIKELVMATRIQCKTYDNCALDKLRKLLPNLQITKERFLMLDEVDKLLNADSPAESKPTSCVSNTDKGKHSGMCTDDQDRCVYRRNKKGAVDQQCTGKNPFEYEIEYRFNVIEEIDASKYDNSAQTLKGSFVCRETDCNNEGNFQSVTNMLASLAIDATAPNSNSIEEVTFDSEVVPNPAVKSVVKSKSSGILHAVSISDQSMIIISILFRQLLN
ncbi:hypothetical protein I4U23_001242 [Adineta vaga]|nr:hypothetical protein I4U23_001242 [Adineta vaga]